MKTGAVLFWPAIFLAGRFSPEPERCIAANAVIADIAAMTERDELDKKVTARIPARLHERLERIAALHRWRMAEAVRAAIERGVESDDTGGLAA